MGSSVLKSVVQRMSLCGYFGSLGEDMRVDRPSGDMEYSLALV